MAAKPDSLATFEMLETYVKMIATKCSQTYSKKVDTIKKIECGQAIPTGSSSTTKVMCMICTYDDGSIVNIDISPIISSASDNFISETDLEKVLSGYTNSTDLEKDFLKISEAYLPVNKNTLNLFSQDEESGELLFNGKTISSSGGTSSNEFTDYFKKKLIGIEENANYFDVQSLQAVNISLLATDANHRTVSETEKSNWNDKYTKSEIDSKLSGLAMGLDWKDGVDDYDTILSTYSNPEKNWTVPLTSGEIYTYNGTKWVQINMSTTPVVNETINGLMTPSMLEKLNGIDENANNFSIDDITADDIADGLSKVIMTSEERLLLKDIPNLYRDVNTKILEKDLDSALLTKLTTKDGDLIDDDLPSTSHTYSSAQIEELFERLTTRIVDPDMDAWFV